MIFINYHNITHDDMNNGDGLRVVLWLSGCSHGCFHCQNPQTWNPDSGIQFDEAAKQEIFDELSKDYISGFTFSGGDPLYESNLFDVLSLVKEIRLSYPEKTIWLYTGYRVDIAKTRITLPNKEVIYKPTFVTDSDNSILSIIRSEILNSVNVIVDGEYIDEQRNLSKKWAGSDNQRVIDTKKSLEQGKVVLYCD